MELAPRDALAWCRLGVSYEGLQEFETAAQHFLKYCRNGDPGRNGCFAAGRMMEKLGNLAQAITYYRLSRLEESLGRAAELEKQRNPSPVQPHP